MTLTKEAVEKRRAELYQKYLELKQQHVQVGLQIEAHYGAVQDCDFWLKQLDEPEPEPEPEPETAQPIQSLGAKVSPQLVKG